MKLTTLSAAGLVKVLVLLAGAGHAAQEAIPWQVKDADVRIPVTVSIDDTLKRMPPDVYLADLNPTGTKGLAFDRKTKSAVMHDLGTPEQRESIIGLSGLDPTEFIPLACDLRGRQVGCRILRAHPGEPMTILFDSSSGEKHYMVYLVPRLTQPLRLDWTPKAGVILECRYPDRYDPAISTLEGLRKLWDGAGFIAGKETVTRYLTGGSAGHDADARRHPATVIAHAFPPFRIPPPVDEMRNFSDASRLRRSSLALARYTGFFHIPETREYEFKFNAGPAGYMLMDDQVISEWRVEDKPQTDQWRKAFKLNLEKGLHKLDFYQYGRRENFLNWFCWALPDNERLIRMFGGREFNAWEPLAEAVAGAMTRRDDGLLASFTWGYFGKEWLGRHQGGSDRWPTNDIIMYSLAGALSQERANAIFRWRFDDGHTAGTQTVDHIFFSSGTRQVELEVLDEPGGKVIARTAGNIHVHADWSNPTDYPDIKELEETIAPRESEFSSGATVRDLLNLYQWSLQCGWPNRRRAIAAALAGRIDDVIGKSPYPRLLELAQTVPMAAHFPAIEKLCNAAMDRAPVGARHWKSAAMVLADNLISVCGEPDKDDLALRIRAEALLALGEEAKATEILLKLKKDVPRPLDEQIQLKLAGDLRRIQRLAKAGGTSAKTAIAILDDWMGRYPMIRTVKDVLMAKAEAFAGMGDQPRAMTLSGRRLRAGISETQRKELMLLQVKIMCKAGKLDATREIYTKLKKFAPCSPATAEAREAITKAVPEKGK